MRHKAQKPVGSGRYASGQKRCQICEIFIKWDGLWCPCCGYRLRTKPRNLKYKAKLRAREEIRRAQQSRVLFIQDMQVSKKNSIRLPNSSNNPNKMRRTKE
jgi:hypothetical protein